MISVDSSLLNVDEAQLPTMLTFDLAEPGTNESRSYEETESVEYSELDTEAESILEGSGS